MSIEWQHGLSLWNEIDWVWQTIDDCQRSNNETSERIWIYEYDLSQSRLWEEDLNRAIAIKSQELNKKGDQLNIGDSEIANLRESIWRA